MYQVTIIVNIPELGTVPTRTCKHIIHLLQYYYISYLILLGWLNLLKIELPGNNNSLSSISLFEKLGDGIELLGRECSTADGSSFSGIKFSFLETNDCLLDNNSLLPSSWWWSHGLGNVSSKTSSVSCEAGRCCGSDGCCTQVESTLTSFCAISFPTSVSAYFAGTVLDFVSNPFFIRVDTEDHAV